MEICDVELAKIVESYVNSNPTSSRKEIINKCKTSYLRLDRIASNGLVKLPKTMTRSQSAKRGNAKSSFNFGSQSKRGNA